MKNKLQECKICHKYFKDITHTHLKHHNLTTKQYKQMFPGIKLVHSSKKGFIPWNKNLHGKQFLSHYKEGKPWNKGLTKETDERVRKLAKTLKEQFRNGRTISKEQRELTSKRMVNEIILGKCNSCGNAKGGYREDLGHFVRSTWEANICRLLKHFNVNYEYENYAFQIKEKTRYIPDLFLPKYISFIEIKGRMTEESLTKINLFKQQYPTLPLLVIEEKLYNSLSGYYRNIVPNWER